MTKRRIVPKIVGTLMALMTVTSAGMLFASADGHTNSPYSFSLSTTADTMYSASQRKGETTPHYLKSESQSNWFYAASYGANDYLYQSTSANGRVQCYINPSTGAIKQYTVTGPSIIYMTNWVREKGYGYASIRFTMARNNMSLSGVWSPDSYV